MTTTLDVPLPPVEAFQAVVTDLGDALARAGVTLEPGPEGRLVQLGGTIGRVTRWESGSGLALVCRPAPWADAATATVDLRLEPIAAGTRVHLELRGWGAPFLDERTELAGWFAETLFAPLVTAISPDGLGEWLTDRRVRRPSGPAARTTYADPTFHWPNFLLILDRIHLRADDRLLEVGCGGGAFLHKALESGCTATGVDHSPEMVRLAAEQNREAIAAGRLTIVESEAYPLPVPDAAFTCAVMTGVIGFLPDPTAALAAIRGALRPGGRLAVFGATEAMRGTPAAPEPFASRIHWFTREELGEVARRAGFVEVEVEEPDLERFARTAQVPEEAIPMFRGNGGSLLLTARRP
jgi:ubiquinone/menaquinone biosynthesis C-methylase UbiE